MGSSVRLSCSSLLLLPFMLLSGSSPRASHANMDVQPWRGGQPKEGGDSNGGIDPTRVTQLSWHPRVFMYEGFLSHEECDHLINLARDKLKKSTVSNGDSTKNILSDQRTSSGMFLDNDQDEIVTSIERRIASWTFLPEENGEDIQILRYEHGEKYEPHFDFFPDKAKHVPGGRRVATVLMYLSNVHKGGETVFPYAEAKHSQEKDDTWSDCARMGYAECDV